MRSDNEDHDLWQHVTQSVKPLKRDRAAKGVDAKPPSKSTLKRQHTPVTQSSLPSGKPEHKPERVNPQTLKRLQRGHVSVDKTIDLHGMTQTKAHQALQKFLLRCHVDDVRRVLVITGKGKDGAGVLRHAVPRWLHESPLSKIVLSLHEAAPEHGGSGALYVLLRRKK